jgi:nicotinamidase-related amidase
MVMIKRFSFIIILLLAQVQAFTQQKKDMVKTALLIVDIQDFYFPGENGPGLVNAEEAGLKAKEVLQIFRDKNQLVVHVRHQSSKGFEINKNVAPLETEKVITKEEVNSFLGTDLLEYLKSHEINRLVIIGMQTHMCLEAAVRAGHDYGFECIVVQDACATRDLKFGDTVIKADAVHASTLSTIQSGGYGNVIDLSELRQNADQYMFQEVK